MKLKEKTPEILRCEIAACPAIFETDHDTYIVIGKRIIHRKNCSLLKNRIRRGETAIEFPKELLVEIIKEKS